MSLLGFEFPRSWLEASCGGVLLLACGGEALDPPPGANGSRGGTMFPQLDGGGTQGSGGIGGGSGPPGGGTGNLPPGSGGFVEGGGGFGGFVEGGGGFVEGGGGFIEGGGGFEPGGPGGTRVFDPGSDPNRNVVQAGQVCARVAFLQCAGEAYCCPNPGRSPDQCRAVFQAACTDDLYIDDISLNPVAGFDTARASAAFAEFERRASTCDIGIVSWATTIEGFRGVMQGSIGPGGTCTPANVLQKADAAAHLASCTGPETNACLPGTITWKCSGRSQVGGPCFTDVNCVDNVYCDNPNLVPTGKKCVARKPDGAGCKTPNECLSLTCKGGACVTADQATAYCLQ